MTLLTLFIIGCLVGSFLNVCILRLPKDESIVFPGSHCVSCKKAIAWYDNIPVFSYLMLGAKCRFCKSGISVQYPMIELLTGGVFVIFYIFFGVTPKGILYLYLALALLVQGIIDFRYKIIPDAITLPAIVISLCASALFPQIHEKELWWQGFWASFQGVLLGGGFLYAAGTIGEWILKKEAMGGGDVKLLAAIGGVIGWKGVLWTIFAASLSGALIGIYVRFRKGEELIPFGPFLALGAILFLFVGPQTMEWYFGWLRGV